MNPRFKALEIIQTRELPPAKNGKHLPSEIFGKNVFNTKVMKHYLSKDVYLKLKESIEHGETLDRDVAGPVANAMKAWSMDKGATHYTHWFQPLTGLTAEKHDSFFELSHGDPIEKFSGEELSQQEPDASSFPSGGLRNTFEARGYTAWDPSSPAFIFETRYGNTLCIPTIFVSYTGEALDFKAPLLKSISLLEEAAVPVCNYFDKNVKKVVPTLGAEQEYFLIDRTFFDLRPDLVLTGRTVFGAAPARGQQLDDHYFGSINERAFAFMNELEYESHKLGIPLKTRHNEVAPSQFECAPMFEELNVAVDHVQLLVDVIDRVAKKHDLRALLHEKPFSRINGSGKHNNWSMATDTGKNLLSPGSNPKENMMFLTFFVSVIKAVHDYADLLRASIASAGNDHRLGANEAPPAIISVFIGSQLSELLDEIEKPPRRRKNTRVNPYLKLGIRKIPEILLDNTDRNRTSPFAFTGNKFEFRAVGSSANVSSPMMILNVIVAEQLKDFRKKVDRKIARGRKKEAAILDVIKDYIKSSKSIRFEGNGYGQEWVDEAETRGLSNVKQTPRALGFFLSKEAKELFTRNEIFTGPELEARYEVLMGNYLNKVQIESQMVINLGLNHVVPPAIRYQKELVDNIQTAKATGMPDSVFAAQVNLVKQIGKHVNGVVSGVAEVQKARKKAEKEDSTQKVATAFAEKVLPVMNEVREHADELENIVPDQLWTLPKYREMLFIK